MINLNTLVLGAVILGSTMLAGCSSNAKIDQLSSDVQTLNAKVDHSTYSSPLISKVSNSSRLGTVDFSTGT